MSTIHDVIAVARAMQAVQEELRRAVEFQSRLTDSLAGMRNFESQITSVSRQMLNYQGHTSFAAAIELPKVADLEVVS